MSQLWDEGNYVGNLVSGVFGKNDKGTQQVVLTFDIEGNKKIVFGYLSPAAEERTFDDLEKLGWNGSMADPQFANGDKVDLYMKHGEPYEGKINEKWMISNGGFKVAPMARDEQRVIEARFKNRKGGSSAPSRPAPGKPAPSRSTAPARPTSAPSKPAPPAFGKDECWAEFEKNNLDNNHFYKCIEEVEKDTKKSEADFNDADWRAVCEAGKIPF